jgi:GNAT superfamily N-acetyltransferase
MNSPLVHLQQLLPRDFDQVEDVYRDAVISQAAALYSPAQVKAWAGHVDSQDGFRQLLGRGYGLVSCAASGEGVIEAFALLDPPDRLALLYCRGRSIRQGRATALVQALQQHAHGLGWRQLRTEASQLSRPLLERLGWIQEAEETAFYAGVAFRRWRMIRQLP